MKRWQVALLIFAVPNAFGFLIGALNTESERDSGHYIKNNQGGLDFISDNKTGCVYKSYSAFIDPGYIAACELFRKRFEKEGFK